MHTAQLCFFFISLRSLGEYKSRRTCLSVLASLTPPPGLCKRDGQLQKSAIRARLAEIEQAVSFFHTCFFSNEISASDMLRL